MAALMRIKAVKINSHQLFTWSSGIRSPIYIDNRIIGSFVITRRQIYDALASLVKKHFPHAQAILGVVTGGMIPANFVAQQLKLPLGYVRSTTKTHGRKRGVEGFIPAHTRVVLIEDTIATGRTFSQAYEQARQNKLTVLGGACIFNYNLLRSCALLNKKLMIKLPSLLTASDLIAHFVDQPAVQQQIKTFLWQLNKKSDNHFNIMMLDEVSA